MKPLPPLPEELKNRYTQEDWDDIYRSRQRHDYREIQIIRTFYLFSKLTNNFSESAIGKLNDNQLEGLRNFIKTSSIKASAAALKKSKLFTPKYFVMRYVLAIAELPEEEDHVRKLIQREFNKVSAYFKRSEERIKKDDLI